MELVLTFIRYLIIFKNEHNIIYLSFLVDDRVGYYVHPTLIHIKNPTTDNKWLKEEIFGPVLCVVAYPDTEYEKYVSRIIMNPIYDPFMILFE